MRRMTSAAKAVGLLKNVGELLEPDEAEGINPAHLLYLCTGSQGEPRAALSRIAQGSHRSVKFRAGDVVIFSSKIIPGNEKGIFALQNALADDGIDIVTEKDRPIHVSGHPCRAELSQMYEWVKPETAIPVHGERRHLIEHAELARAIGIKNALAPHNGEMIRLAPGAPEIVDIVPWGRLHQDGNVIVSGEDEGLRLRKKMAYAGHVSVSIVVNNQGKIVGGPEPRISGFPEGPNGKYMDDLLDDVADAAERGFRTLGKRARINEDEIEDKIQSVVKKTIKSVTGKRCIVEVTAHKV